MKWETYIPMRKDHAREPSLTVSGKTIIFNKAAQNLIKSDKYDLLKTKGALGFHFHDNGTRRTYRSGSNGASMSITLFAEARAMLNKKQYLIKQQGEILYIEL